MPIKLTIAETVEQMDAVYKLRHQVFCEESDKFSQTKDARFFDRFDAYPTSANVIATNDKDVVGALRLAIDSGLGVPADEYYDFRSHLPADCSLLGVGMFCVGKEFRNSRVTLKLIQTAICYAVERGISHVVGPINPDIEKLAKRVGFDIVDSEVVEPHTGLPILPAILDMGNVNDFHTTFAKK